MSNKIMPGPEVRLCHWCRNWRVEKAHKSMKEQDKTWENEDECTEAVKWLKWGINRLP